MKTGRKPYGYYPDEAAVIEVIKIKRRIRNKADEKTKPSVIAHELNREGYKPQKAKTWSAWSICKILERIEAEPKAKKVRAAVKTSLTSQDYLTRQQARDCLAACRTNKQEIVFRTLIGTGLRAAELCALQIRDIGLDKCQVDVRRGKGAKARSVRISAVLADKLREYLGKWQTRKQSVFGTKYGSLYRMVRGIGKRAGISWLHPHVLRHTYATMTYQHTKNVFFVQRQLGHESVETTQIYVKLCEDMELQGIDTFDESDVSHGRRKIAKENTGKLSDLTQGNCGITG